MDEFTYEQPSNEDFYRVVLSILKDDLLIDNSIYETIKTGYCELSYSTTYSKKRWDAFSATVYFYLPQEIYAKNSIKLSSLKTTLLKICQSVMPPRAGYDIIEVVISPIIGASAKETFQEIIESPAITNLNILTDEIKAKGREMAEAYVMLYCIENSLRNFIDEILNEKYGEDYISNIFLPNNVKHCIQQRKSEEKKNLWLPIRGDKDVYYLDFVDLATLITNNWDIFKIYFPEQAWISTKLNELYKVRCLIAHNSYIGKDERDMIVLYYKQLIKQVSK